MRCHYVSDLHLETQDFPWKLPRGDVLILAGDLCHAARLDPARTDMYSINQRERVFRFAEQASAHFRHVLFVVGNHDHYDGLFDDTVTQLRRWLPGFTVLDNESAEIGGVRFFGSTLWSDFDGRSRVAMDRARKGMGEFFFVRVRERQPDASLTVRKFRPEDAVAAFDTARAALRQAVADASGRPLVVITHHAPSLQGLNPLHQGNGLDCAYASDLDHEIRALGAIRYWVHGHTHIRRTYRIGDTDVLSNCRGFDGKDHSARSFVPTSFFEIPS